MIWRTAREESWVRRAMNVRTIIGSSRPLSVSSTCARGVLLASAPVPGGDRTDGSKHMNRVAGVITDDMSRPDAGQDQAVRPLHTMLEGDRRTGRFQDLPGGLRHIITIIGMHEGQQTPMRLMAW